MRAIARILIASATALSITPIASASIHPRTTTAPQPNVASFAPDHSFSGRVEAVYADGLIRLLDGLDGDVEIRITRTTHVNGGRVALRKLRRGSRIHGWGAFRGGHYFAKDLTIDSY